MCCPYPCVDSIIYGVCLFSFLLYVVACQLRPRRRFSPHNFPLQVGPSLTCRLVLHLLNHSLPPSVFHSVFHNQNFRNLSNYPSHFVLTYCASSSPQSGISVTDIFPLSREAFPREHRGRLFIIFFNEEASNCIAHSNPYYSNDSIFNTSVKLFL